MIEIECITLFGMKQCEIGRMNLGRPDLNSTREMPENWPLEASQTRFVLIGLPW